MYPYEPATSAQKQASLGPVIVFVALPELPLVRVARGQKFIPLNQQRRPKTGLSGTSGSIVGSPVA